MSLTQIIAQVFGIIALIIIVFSFQQSDNKKFFIMQAAGCFAFFLNFIMIGAWAGAFFNITNAIRGLLFLNGVKKPWKLILLESLYTLCFVFSAYLIWPDYFEIFISALPFVALLVISVFMYKGNGNHIKICHFFLASPASLIYNVFNLSIGGIICESFNMVSVLVYFLRTRQKK